MVELEKVTKTMLDSDASHSTRKKCLLFTLVTT